MNVRAICRNLMTGTVALLAVALSGLASAAEVRVPINLDAGFLNRVLINKTFQGEEGVATPWNDGTGCNYLVLKDPVITITQGTVVLLSRGEARVGKPLTESTCLTFLDWKGFLQTEQVPRIDPDGSRVRFKVTDSKLLDENMKERLKSKTVWGWVKRHAHPELEKVELDLSAVVQDVGDLLPEFLSSVEASRMKSLIDSMRLDGVRYGADTVITDLVMTLEDTGTTPVVDNDAEPTLTEEELAQWQERWQAWDSFVTYTIKELAGASSSRATRSELLSVMLQARMELDSMLAEPVHLDRDPLRELFTRSWQRLTPLMQNVSHNVPTKSAIQLFGFIAAGDALSAMDKLGPVTGMEVSVAGLRRLARMVAMTESATDPFSTRSDDVDPALRELFDFGPPIPVSDELPPQGFLNTLISNAYADFSVDRLLAKQLNKIVVTPKNARQYVPMVRQLLDQTLNASLRKNPLDEEFFEITRPMVLATAWQESCFRQHVRRGGKMVPLRSKAGAVGLMQVRPSIWRGFYEPASLKNDIGYNARAGTEILLHYMRDYVIAKGEHKRSGGLDNVVRATYATYNGGPGHLKRYRRSSTSGNLRKIDQAFWNKFEKIRGGNDSAPLACFGVSP